MKCFYTAYTNRNNVGDLLITKYQIEEFAKYGEVYVDCKGMPEVFQKVIFDTSNTNIHDFVKDYGISYRSKQILKVFLIINNHGFTLFSGSPGPREPLELPIRKLLLKLLGGILPSLFLNRRVKRIALGVDLNCNFSGLLGCLNKWYFNRFDIIGIRSHTNLKRLESQFKNVIYVPDMAFLYPGFEENSYEQKRKRIALSFRKVDNDSKVMDAVRSIDRAAKSYHLDIDFVYQVEEDRPFCKLIQSTLGSENISFINEPIDFYSLNSYQKYDMVISNRLHVLLMAAMNGALPFGLISNSDNEQKIADIIKDVFGEDHISFLDSFSETNFEHLLSIMDTKRRNVKLCVDQQRMLCSNSIKVLQ